MWDSTIRRRQFSPYQRRLEPELALGSLETHGRHRQATEDRAKIIKNGRKAARAAIMGRNLSHNTGSHVIAAIGETGTYVSRNVVAILNYRSSRGILNVRELLEKADNRDRVRPKEWDKGMGDFRSLTIYDDGSCLLHSLSSGSMIRRIGQKRW